MRPTIVPEALKHLKTEYDSFSITPVKVGKDRIGFKITFMFNDVPVAVADTSSASCAFGGEVYFPGVGGYVEITESQLLETCLQSCLENCREREVCEDAVVGKVPPSRL